MLFALPHLLSLILKYCTILTLIRLLSTAFNWEFGISRQYLRLLELIFQLGKRRIEKAESENKLGNRKEGEIITNVFQEDDDVDWKLRKDVVSSCCGSIKEEGIANGKLNSSEKGIIQQQDGKESKTKVRRISSPNGPPIFLLDEEDFFDNDQQENLMIGSCCGQVQKHQFNLDDACKLVIKGVSAIIDDQVTKRFATEQLKTWNLLTRTNAKNYQFKSRSLGLAWLIGFLIRYTILLPLRIMFTLAGTIWLIATMSLIGLLPSELLRQKLYCLMSLMSFRMLSCGITSRLEFHNRQFKAKRGDICVANHTSPLDVVLLACDNCYALVGQRHGGLIGLLEVALSRATNHVWFDRSEMKDRQFVTKRLKEHVESRNNLPVLIFPEGTCINNSAVMMFRKGSFETTDCVCPVAIKYDARFGDPFWNSAKQTYLQYLLLMMSSWAIKCDVWYLPPMNRLPDETSAEFANRVKAEIARQGGLDDLAWDGQLKRSAPKIEWKYQQQEDYANRLKLD